MAHLLIDLRRKRVKIEFNSTLDEMGVSNFDVDVEVKMDKRNNETVKSQLPAISAKLMHFLTKTNAALLESSYENVALKLQEAIKEETNG